MVTLSCVTAQKEFTSGTNAVNRTHRCEKVTTGFYDLIYDPSGRKGLLRNFAQLHLEDQLFVL